MSTKTLLPPPVASAIKWLARDRREDQHRDANYRRLVNAYEGWLFDLEGGGSHSLYVPRGGSFDIVDVSTEDHISNFNEISVNLIFPLVEDWKAVIGVNPTVYVPSESPGDPTSDAEANLREAIIRGIDADSAMEVKALEGAHYQTLLGCQVQYLVPDYGERRIRKRVVSPYGCHARLALDGVNLHHIAFDIETDRDLVLDAYPDLEPHLPEDKETLRVTEWLDTRYRLMLVEDMWVDGMPLVAHDWGFVPAVIIPNIVGTGSLWSRSEVRQIVHIAQVLSEVVSMQHDALFQNVHDQIFVFADRPMTQMAVGPFEINQLEKDARVQLLRQGLNLPDISHSIQALERFARLVGGWPLVMSSEMDSSIISGTAYTALQGPVSARAAIKHLVMAAYQQRLNAMALHLYEREFGNEEIVLPLTTGGFHTSEFPTGAKRGEKPMVRFVPRRDIAGRYANFLTYPATGSQAYRDSIRWLQYAEAGVVSVAFIRENTPGIDPQAEEKRVAREFMEKAQRSLQVQAMAQQAMQAQAAPAGPPPNEAPPSPPTAEPSGAVAPGAPPAVPPAAGGPEGATPPMAPAEGAAPSGRGVVRISEARRVFSQVRKIRGIVLLGGALAATGVTSGQITVYISDPQDKGTLITQTPYGRQGRLLFHRLRLDENGKPIMPEEPVVNVTPKE